MKKILLALAITTFAVGAQAQHYHRHNHNWIAPAIIGGILGYSLAHNHAIATQPPQITSYPHNYYVYTCPLGFRPVYNRMWTVDQFGRSVIVDNFVGCH